MANGITVVGLDPGLNGGLAAINNNRVILAERAPTWAFQDGGRERRCIDGAAVVALIESIMPVAAIYLENCYGRRNDQAGPQSAFGFGGAFWVVMDRLAGLEVPIVAIQPREWQRAILKVRGRVDRESTKAASISFCKTFHPEADLTPGRIQNPHDGIADSICIAHYGYLQETGINPPPKCIRRPATHRSNRR